MTAAAASASSDFFAQLQPEQKLAGCYLLQRSVEGGPLPIWLAHDEVLGKDISLEFLPGDILSRAGAAERVRQEVKRVRQLIHPRILRVYDLVEEDSWAAVAMDSFSGRPLKSVVASRQPACFDVAEVWPVAREICETLAEAHRIRLPHGGLSMENVLVGDGTLKLINFGITACLHEIAPEAVALHFASPQQLAGARATVSDDVYAVGALLHTLLVGAPPFTGNDRPRETLTVSKHRQELGRAGVEIPQAWEEMIAACLQPEPSARPATCAEIVAKLGAAVQESGVGRDAAAAPAALAAVPAETAPVATTPAAASPASVAEVPSLEAPDAAKAGIAESQESLPAPGPEPKPEASKEEPASSVAATTSAVAGESATPAKPDDAAVEDTKTAPAGEEAAKEAIGTGEATGAAAEASGRPGRPGRRVKPTGRVAGGASVVDEDELAETVRREEFASEPPRYGRTDDEEPFGRHSEAPSLLSLAAIVGVIALLGFGIYRVFFGESQEKPRSAATSQSSVATPEAAPASATPRIAEATPAAEPAKAPAEPAPATPSAPARSAANEPSESTQPSRMLSSSPAPAAAEASTTSGAVAASSPAELEAAVAELKRTIETTNKEMPAARKSAEEIGSEQKKLEESASKAEMAAQDAEKAAAEKKKAAEEARKSVSEATQKLESHRAEVAKREADLERMRSELAEKEHALAAAKKAAQSSASSKTAAATTATSAAAGAAESKPGATSPPDNARSAFEQKMKELDNVLSGGASAGTKAAASPAPDGAQRGMELSKATTPKPAVSATTEPKEGEKAGAAAATGEGFTNSLGMRFVSVPGADGMICIWPTRVRDFEVFAKASGLRSSLWKDPGFKQGPDHPVVNVTWQEAVAFCKWLTSEEQKKGLISSKQSYRLPSDLEWSRAAGLPIEKGATPESRDMSVPDVYPWGTTWPPPAGAGNYTGEETGSDVAIKGYNDGFPWTSPVGSFPPNKLGLYDMGGNVWQWCMDSWNAESKAKVLRGASWYNGALKLSLLTSCRVHASPDSSTDNYGFRVFLVGDVAHPSKK